MYENTVKEPRVLKEIIIDFLDYLKYKVENDKLTLQEADSLAKTIESGLELTGTADDFSDYYRRPRSNVHVVINRKMLSKPKRRVFYSFNEFRKLIPKSWKK